MKLKWESEHCDELSSSSFLGLIDNTIPAIRIPGFATVEECERVVVTMKKSLWRDTNYGPGSIKRWGLSYYEYRVQGKAAYFAQTRRDQKVRDQILKEFDPILRFQNMLQRIGISLEIAHDPKYGNYFVGCLRQSYYSMLHADSAARRMPSDWQIAQSSVQLGWALHLSVPRHGGEVVVYDQLWKPEHEAYMRQDHFGYYRHKVVTDVRQVRLRPQVGEIILINTNNLHEILPTQEPNRLSLNMFIGILKSGQIICWS